MNMFSFIVFVGSGITFATALCSLLRESKNNEKSIETNYRCKNCGFPLDEEKEHCTDCDNFFKYN